MKLLLIGSGGREHAIAWRLRRDDPAAELFIAPGNAGTADLGTNLDIAATDIAGLTQWAREQKPDLTVVGPEAPLCAGVVDAFEAESLAIFGPSRSAARLEGSKVFTKAFLLKFGLPTAPGEAFTEAQAARDYMASRKSYPQVVKADGLAAGKGVIIAANQAEALQAIGQIMEQKVFGNAGDAVVIEDFLPGREMSIHVLTDGKAHVMLPISQDHKKWGDGDKGPNTGGMGAYAPAPFATEEITKRVAIEIVEPVLEALRAEKIDFHGILYIGLIWTGDGPQILEFNVRGGDPETQVLLPLVETPLIEILHAVREGRLAKCPLRFNSRSVVTVVMAAAGYPDSPVTGSVIDGLRDDVADSVVFHGGTKLEDERVLTSGGRVLSVTAWADDLARARDLAYQRVAKIRFAGCHYRHDIAARLTLE